MVESLQNTLDQFLGYIPQLIGAIVILIVGYIVARVLKAVVLDQHQPRQLSSRPDRCGVASKPTARWLVCGGAPKVFVATARLSEAQEIDTTFSTGPRRFCR